ncbi:MAG: YceI family protein [Microthrixaceae bacterium]
MSRGAKIVVGVAVAVVALVVASILALGLLGGSDGPEELSFEDAPTTTGAPSGSDPTEVTPAPTDSLDGAWVVAGGSQAGYRVLEDRIGGLQNIEAVGRTDAVTGGFTLSGTTATDIRAEVQVATITSDSTFRDGRFAGSIMDTATFPTATFTAAQATLPSLPADGGTITVPVAGELTLKGVTRPVDVDLQVQRSGGQVRILGSVPVVFADFGIETPQPPGLSVRDEGTVEFLLVAVPA